MDNREQTNPHKYFRPGFVAGLTHHDREILSRTSSHHWRYDELSHMARLKMMPSEFYRLFNRPLSWVEYVRLSTVA